MLCLAEGRGRSVHYRHLVLLGDVLTWLGHLLNAVQALKSIAVVHLLGNALVRNVWHIHKVDIFFVLQGLGLASKVLVSYVVVVNNLAADMAQLTLVDVEG